MKIYTKGMELDGLDTDALYQLLERLCLKPECGGFRDVEEAERARVFDYIVKKETQAT